MLNAEIVVQNKIIQDQEENNNSDNSNNANLYTTEETKKIDYNKPISSEINDYQDSIKQISNKIKNQRKSKRIYKQVLENQKPKLVIIIDDIANKKQLDEVLSVGLDLTPSIFPTHNPKMLEAIKKLNFFMVHLPLEAYRYNDGLDTIKTNDNIERIEQKIDDIKQTMPNTTYINNHTGSKFTSNKEKTEELLKVLDSHQITFIDSRTTPDTTINEIAKEQNRLILYRDVFIDNKLDSASLKKQLQEGVKIAKDRGYAILIAHPHKETLRALKEAKNNILKDVDIIYPNKLDAILKDAKITQYAKKISNE